MRFWRFTVTISLLSVFLLSSCGYKEPAKEKVITLQVACLGDSITYGYKLADPNRKSYPARLSQQSRGRWQVFNLGVNGATVINRGDIPIAVQKPYQRLMRSEPDVAVIMLGTNDAKNSNWRFIGDFVHDYTVIIETIQRLSSRPHIIVCSVPPIFTNHPSGINSERVAEINVLVKKVVDKTGVDFLDINSFLKEKSSLFIDGIHPNIAGDQKIADLVYKKVSTL